MIFSFKNYSGLPATVQHVFSQRVGNTSRWGHCAKMKELSTARDSCLQEYRGTISPQPDQEGNKLRRPDSNFFVSHSKQFRRLSVQPGLRGSNDLRVGRKMATFQLFFFSRVGLKTYQNPCITLRDCGSRRFGGKNVGKHIPASKKKKSLQPLVSYRGIRYQHKALYLINYMEPTQLHKNTRLTATK